MDTCLQPEQTSLSFTGKVALVTGGGSGIGRATAQAFAREGARVVVVDIQEETGEETCGQIAAAGGEAAFVHADVSQAGAVAAMVEQAVRQYGRLDCAVNNAGVASSGRTSLIEFTEEEWDQTLSVNLKGVWLCMKYEIPRMLAAGHGAIVNVASVAGLRSAPGLAPYAASKHGVIGLTRTAAQEFAGAGLRINAICPGWVRTPLIQPALAAGRRAEASLASACPTGRIATPEEVAEAILWLCSDTAAYVNGHAMVLDGGMLA